MKCEGASEKLAAQPTASHAVLMPMQMYRETGSLCKLSTIIFVDLDVEGSSSPVQWLSATPCPRSRILLASKREEKKKGAPANVSQIVRRRALSCQGESGTASLSKRCPAHPCFSQGPISDAKFFFLRRRASWRTLRQSNFARTGATFPSLRLLEGGK